MGARTTERLAAALLIAALLAIHIAFLTYGTGDLVQGELHGNAFDSLGRSLLRGEATVDPAAIGNEAHVRDGKTFLYFGPFPALLRILPNALFPAFEGQWSRLSCLLASLLCLTGFAALVRASVARNRQLGPRLGRALAAVSLVAFGLGSPLLHLVSYGAIYHECILWGLAFGVWAIHFLMALLDADDPAASAALGFSICTAGALLSRLTFALPLLLILALLASRATLRWWRRRAAGAGAALGPLAALVLPVLCAGLFQAWYNTLRWDSVFVFQDETAWVQTWWPRDDFPKLTPARIPGAFGNYFGLNPPYFSWTAPYIHIGTATGLVPELYSQYREPVASLSVTTSWLVVGGLAGLVLMFRKRGAWLVRLSALAFLAQTLTILMYVAVILRYAADLLPLFLFGFGFALANLRLDRWKAPARAALLVFFFSACLFSIPASVLPNLTWIAHWNLDAPEEAREGLKQRFGELDAARHRFLTR